MPTRAGSFDVWVIVGLALVVFSARLMTDTFPHASDWVSQQWQAAFDSDAATEGSDSPSTPATAQPIVVEPPSSQVPTAPIIVLPSS